MSPTTVADVVARMRTIATEVPASDGAGVFNGVYLRVTEMMLGRLTTGGVFHDDAFIAALDVRFADYWFSAYDASGDKPRAWAPLFAARKLKAMENGSLRSLWWHAAAWLSFLGFVSWLGYQVIK